MTTTRHPDEGTLRRLLDEPGGVADAERQHVDACETCAAELAVIRDDAEVVRAALVAGIDDVDLDAAWQRLTSAGERDGSNVIAIRPRRTFRRPVAAAVVVGAVLAGGSVAAANDWLPIFRAEEVAPVAFDIGALNAVPDLADYG
ncbi:MAG TPA: hypothetical protein VEA78_07840, partial [Acidimicrobiales bacterium]|nr:hypothetical protein [Acidimicrobiales bacterium]